MIPFILEVIDVALEIADIIKSVDEMATGDTPISWGDCINGTCYYYYIDGNGTETQEHGKYSFNTSIHDGYALMAGTHVNVTALRTESTTGTAPTIYFEPTYNTAVWSGGSYYTSIASINGHELGHTTIQTIYPYMPNVIFYENGSTNYSGVTFTVGKPESISFTTMSSVATANPDAVYLPISGESLSYNDIRALLVDYTNEIILSETDTEGETIYNESDTISVDDLPEFETEGETESPDPIECSINYDEILGESELESILTQETYEIPELETGFFTTPTEIEFETAGTLGELESIPEFIVDSVKQAWDVIDLWGLSGVFASCATVAVIWALIKNK